MKRCIRVLEQVVVAQLTALICISVVVSVAVSVMADGLRRLGRAVKKEVA